LLWAGVRKVCLHVTMAHAELEGGAAHLVLLAWQSPLPTLLLGRLLLLQLPHELICTGPLVLLLLLLLGRHTLLLRALMLLWMLMGRDLLLLLQWRDSLLRLLLGRQALLLLPLG